MEVEKGLETGREMLVKDSTILDKDCPVKAIIPYNYDGSVHLDAFKSNAALRPTEETELVKLVAKQRRRTGLSVWDKLTLGLLRWPYQNGYVTGTTFPVTPTLRAKAKFLTTDHNIPASISAESRMEVTLTLAHGDHDFVGGDWEDVGNVVCRGTDDEWAEWDVNRDYKTPKTSPNKGTPVARQIVHAVIADDDQVPDGDDDLGDGSDGDDTSSDSGGEVCADPAEADAWFGFLSKRGLQGSDLESHGRQGANRGKREQRKGPGNNSREPKKLGSHKKHNEGKDVGDEAGEGSSVEAKGTGEKGARNKKKLRSPEPLTPSREDTETLEGPQTSEGGPDFAFFEAATGHEKRPHPNAWYVPDGDDLEIARYNEEDGWTGGTDVYGHTIPGQDADEQYWISTYDMKPAAAKQAALMAKKVYWPRIKGISPGKIIAETETSARITCSFTKGSSGSPVSRLETPLAAVMMHYRAKREYRGEDVVPSNVALKLNAPEIVLNYASQVVPQLLEELREGDWPVGHDIYMKQKLVRYLKRHKKLLQKCNLWEPCHQLIAQKLVSTPSI